jgi:hypothetical protein
MAQPMSDATNEPLGKVNETRLSRTTVRVPREKRQELAQRLEARAMRMSGLEPPQVVRVVESSPPSGESGQIWGFASQHRK